MKLITLNTWGGRIYEPLKIFIENHARDTDIFCFQEIRNGACLNEPKEETTDLFERIKKILPNFEGFYTEMSPGIGIATFIKNTFELEKFDSSTILSNEETKDIKLSVGGNPYPRLIQIIKLKNGLSVLNFHGIPGDMKKDTKERDLQSKRLKEILNKINNPKIIVGDFNLNPDTMAINELEKQMINLIKETEIKTTRSNLYERKDIMPFADYIFVSNDILINNFKVLQDEVSDHLALSVEFE